MLLTPLQLEAFANHENEVFDKSITNRLLNPIWETLGYLIPEDVAPNLISLASSLCLLQAWYLCYTNGDNFPFETTVVAIILITIFYILDAIDSIHARRIGNDSSLTEFFDHMCSSIGTIFLVLTLCTCYSITNLESVWHYVQIGQLLILNKHLSGFKKEYVSYRLFNGPGEAILLVNFALLVRAILGETIMDTWFQTSLDFMESITPPSLLEKMGPNAFENPSLKLSRTLFFWAFVWTVTMTFTLKKNHRVTQMNLLLSLVYLLIPSGLIFFSFDLTLPDVVSRGLVTCVVSSDLLVARFSNRETHFWVVIISMASLVSNLSSFVLVPMYYATILFEITRFTKLPLLSRVINVYQDGIFDMVHLGHMKAFENAAKQGTRLFVGVSNDADATPYKRKPVMSENERYSVVAACKYVYKVIKDAPTHKGSLTAEFIKKHRIHVVCCGEEYAKDPNDLYYKVPREMGITKVLPRHAGMSTSELIKRIQERDASELKRASAALM